MSSSKDPILSLQELQEGIKDAIHLNFSDYLWIHAELSEVNINRNGHCYIELIEKQNEQIVAKVRATIWNFTFRMLKPYFESSTGYEFTSGIKVSLKVSVEFHEVYGLSLNVKDIDPNFTVGDAEIQKRKILNRLEADGIINMNGELELPLVVQNIAVISSATAAGYGDWKNHIQKNSQHYQFNYQLFEAKMQGEQTEPSVIAALDQIYEKESLFDAVVIIRGGGSKTDLASFDSYQLAAHIAQFPLPIITGIGHERDESIADIVAHTDLKTPTAVADFLIDRVTLFERHLDQSYSNIISKSEEILQEAKHRLELNIQNLHQTSKYKIQKNKDLLNFSYQRILQITNKINYQSKEKLNSLSEKINHESKRMLREKKEDLEKKNQILHSNISRIITQENYRLEHFEQLNNALNPSKILDRGFAIVKQKNKIITSVKQIKNNLELQIVMKDGSLKR